MPCKTSIKISNDGISFLKRFRTNRRKTEIDEEDLSYWELIEVIAKYFKLNNDRYLELMGVKNKNV